jgi:FkbM family methyltransferase
MKKKDYELRINVGKKPSFKDIISKSLAKKVGHLPFFRGQDRLVRYFYPPNKFKDLNKGEIFNTEYFGVKYKGITSNYIDWGVYFKGGHEKGLIKFLKKEISNFDIYLDIGANSGTLSLPFIFEEKLDIICFEPLSYSFNKLKTNFEINNAPKRHKLINKAISNQSGISNIYFSKTNENPGFASIDNYFDNKDLSTEKIKLDTIDNLIKVKNKNIIFKIDVEGYEKQVIEGAKNTLKNNNVLMYLECRDKQVIETLKHLNFKALFFNLAGEKINLTENEFSQDVLLKNF